MRKSKQKHGPNRPIPAPLGLDGSPCSIVFGHNIEIQRVLMMFSVAADRLVFTPEEAEDVAAKLQRYARAARGIADIRYINTDRRVRRKFVS